MPRQPALWVLLVVFCAPELAGGATPDLEEPLAVRAALDAARLDPARAVTVTGVSLGVGPASIVLESGTIVPATPVAGRTREFAFVGSGRFLYDPQDIVEAGQLQLFTKSRALDEPIVAAVLVGLSEAASDRLLEGAVGAEPATVQQAEALFAAWRAGPERRRLGVREDLLRETAGDPRMETYFSAWVRGKTVGDFLYSIQPEAPNAVVVGQYKRLELTERERWRWMAAMREDRRAGRLSNFDFDTAGSWDTWSSIPLRDAHGEPQPGSMPFEPRHYTLELVADQGGERVTGHASIDLVAEDGPALSLALELHPDLKVEKVRDGAGTPLAFVQNGGRIVAFLAAPAAAGESLALQIDYSGVLFDKQSRRVFTNWSTDEWYPRTGSNNFATYDVTLRWPKKLDMIGSGVRTEYGDTEDGRWERRVLDAPSRFFGVEVGEFDRFTDHDGRIAIQTAFGHASQAWMKPAERDELRSNTRRILEYYELAFGPYPLDHLTVVTTRQSYAEGMLGFVTIPDYWIVLAEDYRQVLAHEIAHQWWGNAIRPAAARDAWLAEAMAEYASLLYDRRVLAKLENRRVRSPFAGWQNRLYEATPANRPVERIGPVTLGARLNSSRCHDCYDRIVYTKGGMIIEMLAQYLGEETFLPILGRVARNAQGKTLSTDEFFAQVGKQAGVDLSWFRLRYVDGTGLPLVYYSYEIAPGGPQGWQVKVAVEQEPDYGQRFAVVRTPSGRLDARSERVDHFDISDSRLAIRFAIGIFRQRTADGLERPPTEREQTDGNWMLVGTRQLTAARSDFTVDVPEQPLSLRMDPDRSILAQFFCQSCRPMSILRLRARTEIDAGHYEDARRLLREALAAPFDSRNEPENAAERLVRARAVRDEQAAISFNLSRVAVDLGEDAEARAMLAEGWETIASDAAQWVRDLGNNQEARLLLREGRARGARDLLWREVINGKNDTTEGWLLMAIAARETDDAQSFAKALKIAKERGAAVSLLE